MGGNNRFGLNINPQYRSNPANVRGRYNGSYNNGYYGNDPADLRNTYSLTSQLNDFKFFLNQNGMSYRDYQQAKWEAQMMAQEQQHLANQESMQSTFSGIGDIAGNVKGLVDTFKGWFGKKS